MSRLQRIAGLLQLASMAAMLAADLVRQADRSLEQLREHLGELEPGER